MFWGVRFYLIIRFCFGWFIFFYDLFPGKIKIGINGKFWFHFRSFIFRFHVPDADLISFSFIILLLLLFLAKNLKNELICRIRKDR